MLNAIDEMAPWHRGGTMANLGLAWGWRVLSPKWRGRWDGDLPEELPLDYETPNMEKVVVLLTDGNNEWYDWPGITSRGRERREPHTGIPGNNAYPTSPSNVHNHFQNTLGRAPTTPRTAASTRAGSAPPTRRRQRDPR